MGTNTRVHVYQPTNPITSTRVLNSKEGPTHYGGDTNIDYNKWVRGTMNQAGEPIGRVLLSLTQNSNLPVYQLEFGQNCYFFLAGRG